MFSPPHTVLSTTTTPFHDNHPMSAQYVPYTPGLRDALDKFFKEFVDMLVGKTEESNVEKADMAKVILAAVRKLSLRMERGTDLFVNM